MRVLKAYVAAAKQSANIDPGCHISWSLLAGIGRVESDHGRYGGARVGTDGVVSPPIYGPRLNGAGGMPFIHDTDGGRLDGDPTSDRAVGPMQFIPGTWAGYGTDADGNGVANPQDVDDAALSAARYLCAGGGDLSTRQGQVQAVFRYNHAMSYVDEVLALSEAYATGTAVAIPQEPSGPAPSSPTEPSATGGSPPAVPLPTPKPSTPAGVVVQHPTEHPTEHPAEHPAEHTAEHAAQHRSADAVPELFADAVPELVADAVADAVPERRLARPRRRATRPHRRRATRRAPPRRPRRRVPRRRRAPARRALRRRRARRPRARRRRPTRPPRARPVRRRRRPSRRPRARSGTADPTAGATASPTVSPT